MLILSRNFVQYACFALFGIIALQVGTTLADESGGSVLSVTYMHGKVQGVMLLAEYVPRGTALSVISNCNFNKCEECQNVFCIELQGYFS